jgi:RNA polymerase sigma-70 factor (ECF subfamily)
MNKEEELLIRKAQHGNLQAFENLVHRYDVKIMRLIFNMVNDVEDTRDLYQEVFIKVFKSIKTFRFQSEFYTWLFRIVVNSCNNYRKRKAYHQHASLEDYLKEEDGQWRIVITDETRNPEQLMINNELNNQIQKSIDKLSSKQKSVFILKHYHGYKLSEIANILNCAEGTVKNYMFRAVQKMKQSLAEYHQI